MPFFDLLKIYASMVMVINYFICQLKFEIKFLIKFKKCLSLYSQSTEDVKILFKIKVSI